MKVKIRRQNERPRSRKVSTAGLFAVACVVGLGAAAQQPAPPIVPAPQPETAASSAVEPVPESVHLLVGHSLLIRTSARVKRIVNGNPTVLEWVLTSPRELVINAKQTGGSSLMLWEETGQNRMLDVFADLDVTPLRYTLEQSFPNSGVEARSQADKVILVGTVPSAAVAEQMLKMAGNFSKEVVNGLQIARPPRQRQVILKVRFAEADRAKLTQFGINLLSTGAANTVGSVSTQQFGAQSLNTQQQNSGGIIDG